MTRRTSTILAVVAMLCGAGIGAIVAQMNGVNSWLDAKLFLAAGALVGGVMAEVLVRLLRDRR